MPVMRIAMVAGLLIALAAHVPVQAEFQLDKDGDRYTLVARDAPLPDILRRIDDLEPASLRLYGERNVPVTATYRRLTLDQLLNRLGVSYVLIYEGNDQDGYLLGDAITLDSDANPLPPDRRIEIETLVRDLRDDDIAGNALNAMWQLMNIGCDARPVLERALHGDDYQAIHAAASILRRFCPDDEPSDRLLEVTLDLLSLNGYEDWDHQWLFTPGEAFEYLCEQTNAYPQIRGRLIEWLDRGNDVERMQAAVLLGIRGETAYAPRLVRILAPHLADNDLKADAAAAAHALYRLGPVVRPHLEPYRASADRQQAEMADLILTGIEQGRSDIAFDPVMYVGYVRNPLADRPWLDVSRWNPEDLPDENGRYSDLGEYRPTTRDYYGPWP